MTNSKSAQKRVKTGNRNLRNNQKYKNRSKLALKIIGRYIKLSKRLKDSKELNFNKSVLIHNYTFLTKILDKGIKKKVFHVNTVARKKSKIFSNIKNFNS
jgi:ribosomal protein S20